MLNTLKKYCYGNLFCKYLACFATDKIRSAKPYAVSGINNASGWFKQMQWILYRVCMLVKYEINS